MAGIGERAMLEVVRENDHGLYLHAGDPLGEVLLPRGEMPMEWAINGFLDVFLYRDSEDRPVATTKYPRVMPGEFGCLSVVATTPIGAFLDWGLRKDLLLPFREQRERTEVGSRYVVFVYVDEASNRIVASRRIGKFISDDFPSYKRGDEVKVLPYGKTDLGYKVVVDGKFGGVIFKNEVFSRVDFGEELIAYVKQVRGDGKIDLSLQRKDGQQRDDLEERILSELGRRDGQWRLCDKSPPEEIYSALGVSKKVFKNALGALFRKKKILIEGDGIKLLRGR